MDNLIRKSSMAKIKLKINTNLKTPQGAYKKGEIILIEADKEGTPLNHFWRNRLKDSSIDNCVEVISTYKKSKSDI